MPYQSVFRPGLFKGQTIIMTGGGSGIGRCTAHELAALGANVAILGGPPKNLRAEGSGRLPRSWSEGLDLDCSGCKQDHAADADHPL